MRAAVVIIVAAAAAAAAAEALRLHANDRLTFFVPIGAGDSKDLAKLALPWSLMRQTYPGAELLVFAYGAHSARMNDIKRLCDELAPCRFLYFTEREILRWRTGDRYISINGELGLRDLFSMYRNASALSRTQLLVLMQPDCLVRGTVPAETLAACRHDSDAAVCAHHQEINVMPTEMLGVIRAYRRQQTRDNGGTALDPRYFSFTCGSLWKRSVAQRVFADDIAGALAAADCRFDDVCISTAVYMAGLRIRRSNHVADARHHWYRHLAPILHEDNKEHYGKGWLDVRDGVAPVYERVKALFGSNVGPD